MNKVFKVIWSEARNAYVVVSEIAKNMGGKSCSTKKLLAMLIATGVMTCAGVEAGAPQYNEKATNTSGLETYNKVSGFTNSGAVGLRVEQTSANGGNYVIAGVGNMGTYTEGGTIVLYQKESAGNVYEGEVLITADRKYVYTATYDNETAKWTYNTQYQVKEEGKWVNSDKGSIRTNIQRVHAPKNLEYKSVVSKETNGYFQTDTVTTTDSVTGAADIKTNTWQTGDVVTAKVSADKQLTISVNGVETKLTQAVVYVDDNKNKSLKSTNAANVGDNAIALGKGAGAVNNSVAIGDGASVLEGSNGQGGTAVGYKASAGYKGTSIGTNAISGREGATLMGYGTSSSSLYSTVIGTDSVINSDNTAVTIWGNSLDVQGATATVVGAKNTIDNKSGKAYSGVANAVMGSANTVKASNGVTIQGTGNTVTNAYKDMGIGLSDALAILGGDYSKLAQKDSGAVAVIGGANTVSDQSYSTVIGFGNKVAGDTTEGDSGVFLAGSHNKLNNTSNSLVMGDNNSLTNMDASIVLGNSTKTGSMQGMSNVVAIGNETAMQQADNSIAIGYKAAVVVNDNVADGEEVQPANNSVAIGYESRVTGSQSVAFGQEAKALQHGTAALGSFATARGEYSTALGYTSEAVGQGSSAIGHGSRAVADESVALGAGSVANREAGRFGYDAPSEDEDANSLTWKSNAGAVSVGYTLPANANTSAKQITRQITNVAAGSEDTDAVNVAQLKKAKTEVVQGSNVTVEPTTGVNGQNIYTVSLNSDINVKKITTNSAYVTNVDASDNSSVTNVGYVNQQIAGAALSAGNGIDITNKVVSVKLKAGETNLEVDESGLSLKKALKVNSVDAGGTVIDSDGLKIGNKTYVSSEGLNANDQKIINVAPGEISATSTDAINGSQLHETNERVAKVEGDISNINTEITSIKGNITTINNRIDGIDAEITEINNKVETNTQNIATNTENISKLNVRVANVEELAKQHTTVEEGSNITVTEGTNDDGGKKYTVALDNEISLDKVTTGNAVMNNDGLKVGANVSVTKDAVTAGSTSISDDGLKIGDKTYVSSDGLNANSQKITNVAAGEADTDAVNVSQLNAASEQIINNSNRISKLGDRVNKVGAGAAALAALHPMDFDPDDKWSFAAGYGNYAGQNAAAIGAYYRPDEKVMFSVGGTVGNGENMVNAGISFALDRTNRVSNSRTAMAREIVDLRGQLTQVTAELASLKATLGVIDETKTKLFPDVPANHWAYEYISKLAGNGYVEGYPDGNFDGNRLMTRYEFAAMLYRAMEKGAALEERIINEFAPELGRIRVDRISGKDGDRDKIERVRVNGPKNERDHYGSKLK